MDHGKPLIGADTPLIAEMREEAYRNSIPLSISVELTLRCNIKCVHCYNFDRDKPNPFHRPELTVKEWKRVFGELRDAGTLFLAMTGGEALVHPNFWELLEEATRLHFAVTLLSNGTPLTDKVTDRLSDCPSMTGVALSLYGASAEVHDRVTQVPGSFQRTIKGADRMRARGVIVNLKFILMKGNVHEVVEMIQMAERLDLPYQIDSTITGRYDKTFGSLATRIDEEELRKLYQGPLRHLLTQGKAEPTDDEFKCNCARGNGAVFSNGDVTSCIAVPLPAGNVRNQPFGEIWRNSPVFQRIRGLKVDDFKTCAPCRLKQWCRRSPGPPTTLHGDYTGVDPWHCEEAAVIQEVLEV